MGFLDDQARFARFDQDKRLSLRSFRRSLHEKRLATDRDGAAVERWIY